MNKEDSQEEPVAENQLKQSFGDTHRIKELRARLYARVPEKPNVRHTLPQHEINDEMITPTQYTTIKKTSTDIPIPESSVNTPPHVQTDLVAYTEYMSSKGKRKSFRTMFIILGIFFFVAAVAASSFSMYIGENVVSGENILIDASGPVSIGGGEEISFKATVANQNTVDIQSATLIIDYPEGTQSTTEANKEIDIVRQSLDTIGTGELINIPLQARIFGEENEEKEIKVSIEYRIAGSNATFHKPAEPLRFKISTSPVVMNFDSVKSISSGQDLELKLTLQSNSSTPLADVLVKVSYPEGFDFNESSPETLSGEDVWKFGTLKPNEKKVITIKGLLTGYEDEVRQFSAQAGVANDQNSSTIASQLATSRTEVSIEQPFLKAEVTINGSSDETVIMGNNESASVQIRFGNNLDFSIYEGRVEVQLEGNALDELEVKSSDGFYDSVKNTIVWDGTDEQSLKEILPGRTANLSFSMRPEKNVARTPEVNFKVTVHGKRIFEDRASQDLVGTVSRTLKIESVPVMSSEVLYNTGPFTNTGPVPPVAEKVTQYTYVLKVKSGANNLAGTEVTAVLPTYVSWLDLVTSNNNVTYNSVTRTMRWIIGNMDANSEKEVGIQVSLLPSISQIGITPTILESQRLKATDRFTGTTIRLEHSALTTSLYGEEDKKLQDGNVQGSE